MGIQIWIFNFKNDEYRSSLRRPTILILPIISQFTISGGEGPAGEIQQNQETDPRSTTTTTTHQQQQHQAPGLPGGPNAELGQMGIRNPGAPQEIAHLARHLPHTGDGGACARRRRGQHQGRLRHTQFPRARRRPAPPRLPQPARRPGRRRQGRRHG